MSGAGWASCWRLARRDLTAGLRGLRLLFVCLLLGVATLAAIGSLTAAISAELAANGQTILGGDVEASLNQREATAAEMRLLRAEGELSETVRTQAMGQRSSGDPAAVLAELKGVDSAYPLYGAIRLEGRGAAPAPAGGAVMIDPALAARLAVGPGDRLRFGAADFTVAGIIAEEPDRVGEGFNFGPTALVSLHALRRTGLLIPGALFESKYRIRIAPGADPQAVAERLRRRLADPGWELRTREHAAPGASRFFERMGQFLALIGLAALAIAGIGVGNGVASYLAGRQDSIATLKILGASSADIARIYLLQIGLVAALAVAIGLAIGAMLPPLAVALAGELLPVRPGIGIHPLPLLTSAAYGLLIALAFALVPLTRARRHPAAALFRSLVDRPAGIGWPALLAATLAGMLIVLLALASAREPWFAGLVLGAVAGTLLLLVAIGLAVRWAARRLPSPRRPLLRLALANLHRPGSQTVALVIALGLSLTLFVAIAAIETSIRSEIARSVPQQAPDQFLLDIPASERARFEVLVRRHATDARLNIVPTLRGTITAFAGQRVADLEQLPDGAWFLRGDRGVTYSAAVPESSELIVGRWWPPGYRGPPLVSLDQQAAEVLGIGVGDTLTVSVLGREFEARIASLRRVNWRSLGLNYILVFPPATLESAPHNLAATVTVDGAPRPELTRALLAAFPSVSVIEVGELLGRVQAILRQMASAILIAASVTVLAGIAVLAGAIAASRQARSYDSVVLKVLGATRRQILGAQALEFGLLALLLAAVASALGLGGAWYVVVRLFEFGWAPHWPTVLATLGGGAMLTLGIGLAGSLPLISVRPAAALRAA